MAGRGAPTFLKRQKEQARQSKALAKRQAKQQRRENRALGINPDENLQDEIPALPPDIDPVADDTPAS